MRWTACVSPAASAPGSEPRAKAGHQPLKPPGRALLLSKVGTAWACIWAMQLLRPDSSVSSLLVNKGRSLRLFTGKADDSVSIASIASIASLSCLLCTSLRATEPPIRRSDRGRACSGNGNEPEQAQGALGAPHGATFIADVTLCLDGLTQEGSCFGKAGAMPCSGY